MTGFISHAHGNIWGAGATAAAAVEEATRNGGENIQALTISRATPRLLRAVAEFTGGHPIYPEDVLWETIDDVADLVVRAV